MKPYRVTVEVTTAYTVEVDGISEWSTKNRVEHMDLDEIVVQGSVEGNEFKVIDAEEIQREREDEDTTQE